MAITYIPWTPVYNYGCGWRECPECGPMIELEIERRHLKRVNESNPQIDQQSEWLAECYGTGAERVEPLELKPRPFGPLKPLAKAQAKAKAAQKEAKSRRRVRRSLSEASLNEAQGGIDRLVAICRRTVAKHGEWELRNQAWAELLNPSALVATHEKKATLDVKVKSAFDRARAHLDKLARASTRDAGTSGQLEAA
jgi:hypothetical protein